MSSRRNVQRVTTKKRQTSRHLTLGEIRGIVQLYQRTFTPPTVDGKTRRFPSVQKKQRWVYYKNKCFEDYGRVIKGTFQSERAFIKRYSDPLSSVADWIQREMIEQT